jgi:hypothetical protein
VTKWLGICFTIAALSASTACNNNDSPAAPTPTQANFTVSVQPATITATRCNPKCPSQSGSATFGFSATITLVMQESAGIGANITAITLTGTTGGLTFPPLVFSASDITQAAGGTHISGHGSLAVPVTIVYDTPSGTADLVVNISVQLTDDGNKQVSATSQATII